MSPHDEGLSDAAVGRVIGTEDATPLTFSLALAPGRFVQLDDVVVCDRTLPMATWSPCPA
jgi:hypothetical protein